MAHKASEATATLKGPFTLTLVGWGNPDFGQDPDEFLAPHCEVPVADWAEASAACRRYVVEHGLGGGNWGGTAGKLRSGDLRSAEGVLVARVSYNGRVWPPGEWTRDMKPLWG